MTESAKKQSANDHCDTSSCRTEEQRQKISEVRAIISPFPDKLGAATHSSDESISRYLISQKWNVQKASKMLNESFKWRLEYKPEEIRWEHIAYEAELGKIYRLNFEDKQGRTVLVIRPRFQNSKSIELQMKYLVYCMEKAIMNHEEMIWLVDFHGFKTSNISLKSVRRTSNILQNYYPQRLATVIMYDPPSIFEPFWKVVKLFVDPEITEKVKFVYSNDPKTSRVMEEMIDMEKLDVAFGGKDDKGFCLSEYAKIMKEEDKKMALIL